MSTAFLPKSDLVLLLFEVAEVKTNTNTNLLDCKTPNQKLALTVIGCAVGLRQHLTQFHRQCEEELHWQPCIAQYNVVVVRVFQKCSRNTSS